MNALKTYTTSSVNRKQAYRWCQWFMDDNGELVSNTPIRFFSAKPGVVAVVNNIGSIIRYARNECNKDPKVTTYIANRRAHETAPNLITPPKGMPSILWIAEYFTNLNNVLYITCLADILCQLDVYQGRVGAKDVLGVELPEIIDECKVTCGMLRNNNLNSLTFKNMQILNECLNPMYEDVDDDEDEFTITGWTIAGIYKWHEKMSKDDLNDLIDQINTREMIEFEDNLEAEWDPTQMRVNKYYGVALDPLSCQKFDSLKDLKSTRNRKYGEGEIKYIVEYFNKYNDGDTDPINDRDAIIQFRIIKPLLFALKDEYKSIDNISRRFRMLSIHFNKDQFNSMGIIRKLYTFQVINCKHIMENERSHGRRKKLLASNRQNMQIITQEAREGLKYNCKPWYSKDMIPFFVKSIEMFEETKNRDFMTDSLQSLI